MFSILWKKKIDTPGFSLAIREYKQGYIGAVRVVLPFPVGAPRYPELYNSIHILEFDENFDIKNRYVLNEDVDWGQPKYVSWCTGIEDARFLPLLHDHDSDLIPMVGVAHGTNPNWVTKM